MMVAGAFMPRTGSSTRLIVAERPPFNRRSATKPGCTHHNRALKRPATIDGRSATESINANKTEANKTETKAN